MVDASEACESQYITVDLVRESNSKEITICDPGDYEDTDFGRKLTFKVSIDGKEKIWRPNRDTCANLKGAWGGDTADWSTKQVRVQLVKVQGRDSIIGTPVQ